MLVTVETLECLACAARGGLSQERSHTWQDRKIDARAEHASSQVRLTLTMHHSKVLFSFIVQDRQPLVYPHLELAIIPDLILLPLTNSSLRLSNHLCKSFHCLLDASTQTCIRSAKSFFVVSRSSSLRIHSCGFGKTLLLIQDFAHSLLP